MKNQNFTIEDMAIWYIYIYIYIDNDLKPYRTYDKICTVMYVMLSPAWMNIMAPGGASNPVSFSGDAWTWWAVRKTGPSYGSHGGTIHDTMGKPWNITGYNGNIMEHGDYMAFKPVSMSINWMGRNQSFNLLVSTGLFTNQLSFFFFFLQGI